MVLSSRHSHCESSASSLYEYKQCIKAICLSTQVLLKIAHTNSRYSHLFITQPTQDDVQTSIHQTLEEQLLLDQY